MKTLRAIGTFVGIAFAAFTFSAAAFAGLIAAMVLARALGVVP